MLLATYTALRSALCTAAHRVGRTLPGEQGEGVISSAIAVCN